ncbi:pyridoxine 5'-phosphate oxidase C-terminal domain-containing protein [Streptomyces sp. NPDC051664]|uniref:pyridoxine 5'-phosphate oxidase C-terminal domain-containing protein n=1 Tax=Streptomyces sp. NPDC051664 TaxID=3365668 RepID=UPI0037AD89AE
MRDAAVRRSLARVEREPDLAPPGWTLHSVRPQTVEFWQGDKQRNHARSNYRATDAGWEGELLWP